MPTPAPGLSPRLLLLAKAGRTPEGQEEGRVPAEHRCYLQTQVAPSCPSLPGRSIPSLLGFCREGPSKATSGLLPRTHGHQGIAWESRDFATRPGCSP